MAQKHHVFEGAHHKGAPLVLDRTSCRISHRATSGPAVQSGGRDRRGSAVSSHEVSGQRDVRETRIDKVRLFQHFNYSSICMSSNVVTTLVTLECYTCERARDGRHATPLTLDFDQSLPHRHPHLTQVLERRLKGAGHVPGRRACKSYLRSTARGRLPVYSPCGGSHPRTPPGK